MKRKMMVLTLTLMLLISILGGCSDNSYENYLKAVEKTNAAIKYSGEFSMSMQADIDTSNLSGNNLKNVNLYNNFEVSSNYKSDNEAGLIESNIYINFGGLGFDIKYYDDSNKAFIKMPIVEKYVYLEELSKLNTGSDIGYIEDGANIDFDDMAQLVSDESAKELSDLWKGAIDNSNIVKGKESLIETKEGEVKATKYSIRYEDKLFKDLILKSMEILYMDEYFMNSGLITLSNGEGENEFDIHSFEKEILDLFVIEDFEIVSYIDIDGYIVEEDMKLVMTSKVTDTNKVSKINLNYRSKMFNFEKDQNIIIPSKEDLDFMTEEDMKTGLPSLFEDVFSR